MDRRLNLGLLILIDLKRHLFQIILGVATLGTVS